MKKKFELTNDFIINDLGIKLYRIKALKDFSDVKKGDFGGYIQRERNLSQLGDAWVYGDAQVFGDAEIYGNAWVYGNAEIYGNAQVFGNAWIYGNTRFFGDVAESGE